MGVHSINYMFLEIKRDGDPIKPTHNSGDSSHYRQFARADLTGACSFYDFDLNLVVHEYNGAMQVLL